MPQFVHYIFTSESIYFSYQCYFNFGLNRLIMHIIKDLMKILTDQCDIISVAQESIDFLELKFQITEIFF